MGKMDSISWLALILIIIGGLNWGLVGFFNYNLVAGIFGVGSTLAAIIYDLVGLSAIWITYKALVSDGSSESEIG